MHMLSDYVGKYYRLYVDNFYTSPSLFYNLWKLRTQACGTSRPRKGLPQTILDAKLKAKGDNVTSTYVYNGRNIMSALKIRDRKVVTFLSTLHNANLQPSGKVDRVTGEPVEKPEVMLEYNKYMGGVDINDQLLQYAPFARRSNKWWKKVLFRLLNVSMVNAYVLYSEWKPHMMQIDFRVQVIKQLIS